MTTVTTFDLGEVIQKKDCATQYYGKSDRVPGTDATKVVYRIVPQKNLGVQRACLAE